MVHTIRLDHLEYKEAILDGPEFREKLRKHEKHISDTSKSIKILLKKFEDVITASEVLRNAQDAFSSYLKEFQLGFVGDTNEEESDIVDTLDSTCNLVQEIKEFSTKMINTGHALFRQLDNFRKEKIDTFKEKKKEYERQTIRYCSANEKYLTSSQSSKKDRSLQGNEDSTDFRENDRDVKEENQAFYRKCLDYMLCIQEFEEKWFHFFAESIFAFIQSWTTFYHEGYEKHLDYETRYTKSNGGLQALRINFDYFKSRSHDMINDILKNPEFHMNSFQTMSNEHFVPTTKQGYLYLIEKKTLGTSTRVKQFCKYYKETKRLEVIPYNQITNKMHPIEYYTVISCQKSNSDKRFVLEVSLREKNYSNVHIYQAMSLDDFKSWFGAMEGKELTPVLSPPYPLKNDPIYQLDRNGINFIRKCIKILEDEKINEEGIYRKNGVSHKINQFIERNFVNLASSTITPSSNSNSSSLYGINQNNDPFMNESSSSSAHTNSHHSLFSSVIKSTVNNFYLLSHSSSSATLNAAKNEPSSVSREHSQTDSVSQAPSLNHHQSSTSGSMIRNNSNTNLNNSYQSPVSLSIYHGNNDLEDTCTITSALKHYLIHLKEPLMTYHFNQQFLNTCRKDNLRDRIIEIHRLIHMLPPLNLEVLEALIKHLYKVSTHSAANKMTASNLATCFGPTIFRTEQECVSNLYNIKFYSEIIELLMLHHEKIFDKILESSFLDNLTPLKTPATMAGSANVLSPAGKNPSPSIGGGGGTSSSSSSIISSSTPNTKLRSTNSISLNPINRRAIYEPSYKNMLMNSSKTSVSSDSSQSDREQQLSSSQNLNLSQLTSTLSSSLTHMSQNNVRTSNNTSSYMSPLKTLTSPNTPAKTLSANQSTNGGVKSQHQLVTPLTASQSTHLPTHLKKAYNSQKGPFQSDLDPKLASSYSGINNISSSGNKYSQSTTATQFSVNNVNMNNLSLNNSPNKSSPPNKNISSTSSPVNSKSTPSSATNTSTTSLNLSLASGAVSPLVGLDGTKPKRARTLYPCEADNPSELSFEANVIIYNIRRSKESGWLEGTLNGKSGLVPGNYVQILDD